MKKIGLICLAVVLALGGLGVGLAMWSETLTIDATVDTADIDPQMFLAKNAIGHTYVGNPTSPPPVGYTYAQAGAGSVPSGWGGTDDGNWDSSGQKDNDWNGGLGANCPAGPIINWWGGDKGDGWPNSAPDTVCGPQDYLLNKDVGSTVITTDGTTPMPVGDSCAATGSTTMHIEISNAYPQYVSGASFCVVNHGSMPIEVVGFSTPTGIPADLIVAFLDYPFAFYDDQGVYIPGSAAWWFSTGGYGCYVFDGAATGLTIPDDFRQQLDEGDCRLMGIYIEVLQSADEGGTYSFDIEVLAQQWNEP